LIFSTLRKYRENRPGEWARAFGRRRHDLLPFPPSLVRRIWAEMTDLVVRIS
jgi:hypothetical protein